MSNENNLTHDPEYPYVVVGKTTGIVQGKFRTENTAATLLVALGVASFRLVNTTPPPRIPADAPFIFWKDFDGDDSYARRLNTGEWMDEDQDRLSEERLIAYIGDATITPLYMKDPS
ncbi:hypothetical protein SEA_ZOOMAN_277 [Microbacterium phage Zooman]|nr:hypothetical protein SEA_ZOOMAN_277 [Microbacterium phage Zooman]